VAPVAERLGVPQPWLYHRIYTGQLQLRRAAATQLSLFPDQPDTRTPLQDLKLGHRTIVHLDREHHYE
jgi:hypothetical protein